MSISDKPRRQSFALGQERKESRVPSIKEELTDKSLQKPEGEMSGVRKSMSLFRRRKSMQLDDSQRGASESRLNSFSSSSSPNYTRCPLPSAAIALKNYTDLLLPNSL